MAYTAIPHLALPIRLGPDGSLLTVEQDSVDEVGQCVEVLLRTRIGTRIELPRYGIHDPAFELDVDRAHIIAQMIQWEPRAAVGIESEPDRVDELIRWIRFHVHGRP